MASELTTQNVNTKKLDFLGVYPSRKFSAKLHKTHNFFQIFITNRAVFLDDLGCTYQVA